MSYELAFKAFLWGTLISSILLGMYVLEILSPFIEPYVDFAVGLFSLVSGEN